MFSPAVLFIGVFMLISGVYMLILGAMMLISSVFLLIFGVVAFFAHFSEVKVVLVLALMLIACAEICLTL